MTHTVNFSLEDTDLAYFREIINKAKANTENLSESSILANARKLSSDITKTVPNFVRSRLHKLELLVAMVEDDEWQVSAQDRSNILTGLAYFSNAKDLVPDHSPVLGFLDDAIMIELVAESLTDNIEAYQEFCTFRDNEHSRDRDKGVTRLDWLADKRHELLTRIKRRHANYESGNTPFRIF